MSERDWKNHEPPKGYVTRQQAASMMGMSTRTLARYIKKGRFRTTPITDPIPGVPWTCNETFYRLDDIVRFLSGEN